MAIRKLKEGAANAQKPAGKRKLSSRASGKKSLSKNEKELLETLRQNSGEIVSLLSEGERNEMTFRLIFRFLVSEIEETLNRAGKKQEEIDQIASQTREAMFRLKAA